MKHTTTITADTTSQENVTANVELTIFDNVINDVIINCPEKLDGDSWNFFYFEAVNELGIYPENVKDFAK